MQTEILPIDSQSIVKAKQILENGGIIGMPTETVYGLGAIGTDATAVKKIFVI